MRGVRGGTARVHLPLEARDGIPRGLGAHLGERRRLTRGRRILADQLAQLSRHVLLGSSGGAERGAGLVGLVGEGARLQRRVQRVLRAPPQPRRRLWHRAV